MYCCVCASFPFSIPDVIPIVLPIGEFYDCVVPHLLAKDVHVHVDLLLQERVESWVGAFDENHEGVDRPDPFDSLREGDAMLTVSGFAVFGIVPCSWSVDDGDEGISRVPKVVSHH